MLRLLGQSEYGLFQLVSSVISYLGLLNFGFGSTYIRFYMRYKANNDYEKIKTLNGMFLIIFSIIGTIAVIAGIILAMNSQIVFGNQLTASEHATARILMYILTINIALTFPGIVFTSYITTHEKFIFQRLIQIIQVICQPFLILPLLLLGYGSIGMVSAITIISLGTQIATMLYGFKKLKFRFSFKEFDFILLKEMSIFTSFVFISMVIDKINWQVDKFILGHFYGTITVAIYAIAAQLSTYYIAISSAISSVFTPRIHRMITSEKGSTELNALFVKVGRVQYIILSLIATGVIFFGKQFLIIWAGIEYSESYRILMLLIIPSIVPLIQNIGIQIQQSMNKHKFRSILYLIIALLNVGVTIPLAKLYGGFGAAIGTAGAHIIGHIIIMNWYYQSKIGLDIKNFWIQIGKLSTGIIPSFIIGYIIVNNVNIDSILTLFVWGISYIIIFLISIWLLGMNEFEKNLIKKPIYSILKKLKIKN